MPLYEYLCGSCGHRFERIQKFSDGPIDRCPSCGAAEVTKLISSPAIQFKGTGWYVTDYAKSGKSAASSSSSDSSGDKSAATDSSSSDSATKPAASESPSSGGKTTAPTPAKS